MKVVFFKMTPKILPCYRYKDRVMARELDQNDYSPMRCNN